MAPLYILLQFLLFQVRFSDEIGIDFLTKITSSNLNSTELWNAMIKEQIRLCPYIALCTSKNISVFRPTYSYLTPCCQRCSCDYACVEEGSCCPDFKEEDYKQTPTQGKTSAQLVSTAVNGTLKEVTNDVDEAIEDKHICVKTQYGAAQDSTGVMMIGSCPAEYKGTDVERDCKAEFDYSRPFNILKHIPVTNIVTGLTYKNRYCELCNKGGDIHVYSKFWDIWIKCQVMANFAFHYIPVTSPFEFVERTILDQTKICNVIFGYDTVETVFNITLNICERDSLSDSCEESPSNNILQELCSGYFWPIIAKKGTRSIIYRNYACALCDGVRFKEYCPDIYFGKTFTYSMTPVYGAQQKILPTSNNDNMPSADTDHLQSTHADSITSTLTANIDHQGEHIIMRYFLNKAGEVHCRKGFVYDSKKDVCRLVRCPLYFFIKKGECVPIFDVVKRVSYQVLLQADVPYILGQDIQADLETAIAASLDKMLTARLGEGLYKFFILRSDTMIWNHDKRLQYFITLAISSRYDNGRYTSVLQFINDVVFSEGKFDISVKYQKKAFKIFVSFNTSVNLTPSYMTEIFGYHLVKSSNGTENIKNDDNGTPFVITPVCLCHVVAFSDNEVKGPTKNSINSANGFLTYLNFVRSIFKDKMLNFVCLHHAFKDIPESVSYIFLNKNGTKYRFVSRSKVKSSINLSGFSKTDDKDSIFFEKSAVATVSTIIVVGFVIFIRQALKRYGGRTREFSTDVDGPVSSIEMENIISQASHAERSNSFIEEMTKPTNHGEALENVHRPEDTEN